MFFFSKIDRFSFILLSVSIVVVVSFLNMFKNETETNELFWVFFLYSHNIPNQDSIVLSKFYFGLPGSNTVFIVIFGKTA